MPRLLRIWKIPYWRQNPTRGRREIVLDYQTENSEKDRIIKHLEKQVKSLRDTIIQLQSKSELEEITGREETERLYQMQLITERELSEQVAIIQELKINNGVSWFI
jgi:hypothetical protein